MTEYPRQDPPPKERRFPVWLVLLGCAAISIALWIMYPAYASARAAARKTGCLSNVRDLAWAEKLYEVDYDDRTVPVAHWADELSPYVRDYSVYDCPDLRAVTGRLHPYGYALNASLDRKDSNKIARPEVTPFDFDCSLLVKNAAGGKELLPQPGRHDGMDNVGFADGHAKVMEPGKVRF